MKMLQVELYKMALEHLRQRKLGHDPRNAWADPPAKTGVRDRAPSPPKGAASGNEGKLDVAKVYYRAKVLRDCCF